jgi:two-component sensor histidine kinase
MVFYLNKKNKAHISITIMFVTGSLLLTFYSVRSGEASLVHMLFVLNIIGLAALYRKGRIRVYYLGNLLFTLVCLGFVLLTFEFNWFPDFYNESTNHALDRKINMGFLVFCSILFSIVVVDSFSRQFSRLKRSADEKDILLAELNHRVKNNLSIIVSLLRLKQELSNSEETKSALRDVGNRIHSMALVHRRMYDGEGKSVINVPSYVDDLMEGICQSLGDHPDITCNKDIEDRSLEVSSAIPIGMILNELIMNSLKHAFENTEAPYIGIKYEKLEDGRIRLFYEDNGVGMDESDANLGESLGLEIIHSLAEQLDGKCEFYNRGGLKFELFFEE